MSHKKDISSWPIGGGLLVGLGIGFFLLPNGLAFAGSLIVGLGLGLIVSAVIKKDVNGGEEQV